MNNQSRSLRWLDALIFVLADVQNGVGPFLAIYLQASHHWDPASIGLALSITSITAPLAQMPAGALVDQSHHKRALIALAALAIGLCSISVILMPNKQVIYITQVVIGISTALIIPTIAAISLGIVGTEKLDGRIARNESVNHAGNVLNAIAMGTLGYLVSRDWIFFFVALLCSLAIVFVLRISSSDIDDSQARHNDPTIQSDRPSTSFGHVLHDQRLMIFLACATLFHSANGAMLPLVGQRLGAGHPQQSSLWLAACIIVAEVVMVPMAILTGRLAKTWGRKQTLLAGLCLLPVRGILYTLSDYPPFLLGVEVLDGISAAIFGVTAILIVSDLTINTGRFNITLGTVLGAAGLGAAISNIAAGEIAKQAGYSSAFAFLSVVGAIALLVFWAFMPETLLRRAKTKARVKVSEPPDH